MRILQILVGAGARAGGPPAFVGGAALELERLGDEIDVLATDLALAPWGWVQPRQGRIEIGELHPTLARAGVELFPARFPRRLAFSPALRAALSDRVASANVVHIHNLWQYPQYAAYQSCLRHGIPYVVSTHGAFDPYLRQGGRVRKRVMSALWQNEMLSRAATIHVTTEAERGLIADVAPEAPRSIVPCGLDVNEFAKARLPSAETFRHRRLAGYDGQLLLFLGRITRKKGLDVLLRAFALLKGGRECRLAIVGPDDEGILPSLLRLRADLGLEADVDFLDPVYGEERLAALSSADVWVLSSHAENFGIAVVEAMAAGCAVAISPAVNIAPEIAAADAGVVAEAHPVRFAEAVAAILDHGEHRERLRQAAPRFAARYDWSIVGPQLREMYRGAALT